MRINIIVENIAFETEAEANKTALDIMNSLNLSTKHRIMICKVDNEYQSLNYIIEKPCSIEYLDMTNNEAWLVYQHSLTLLYNKAINDLYGDILVHISNSLNKGLYTTLKKAITNEDVEAISQRMHELVDEKLPIISHKIDKETLLKELKQNSDKEKYRLFQALPDLDNIEMYSLGNYNAFFYSILVPNTSFLTDFELVKYRNGILLRYPHISNPSVMPPYENQQLLYDAFSQDTKWAKLMGINYVADLNERIRNNQYEELIMMQEALHEKKISEIAEDIKEKNKRIILICGPSSSGKTSFAKRLSIQLQVIGLKPLYLGTDDYFVERNETVLNERGEKDFESIKAVDVKLFNEQLNNLLEGKTVDIPVFDFINGTKVFGKRITSIDKHQPIIIEGIHSLNNQLTRDVDDEEKYKIYISPLTSLNIDNHNRIPTTDARMLRRLVRDYQFRGHSAAKTIKDWPSVRRGEDTNIFPFINEADVFFNTNYIYELAVLKKYALPLLKEIKPTESEYAQAQRMLSFLRFFETIEDDTAIANNSILREFIGGSILVK